MVTNCEKMNATIAERTLSEEEALRLYFSKNANRNGMVAP